MNKLYIISTVGGFDMKTTNIEKARKELYNHASKHPNVTMGIYELIHTVKLSKYSNGRIRWHSRFNVNPKKKKKPIDTCFKAV